MNSDITVYIAEEYLPEGYRSGSILTDTHRLSGEMVVAWVAHLQYRQELYLREDLDTVLKWNIVPELCASVPTVRAVVDTDAGRKRKRTKKSAKSGRRGKRTRQLSEGSDSEVEMDTDVSDTTKSTVPSLGSDNLTDDEDERSAAGSPFEPDPRFASDAEVEVDVDERGIPVDADGNDIGSPYHVGSIWTARLDFLYSLCPESPYTDVVDWLQDVAVSE